MPVRLLLSLYIGQHLTRVFVLLPSENLTKLSSSRLRFSSQQCNYPKACFHWLKKEDKEHKFEIILLLL